MKMLTHNFINTVEVVFILDRKYNYRYRLHAGGGLGPKEGSQHHKCTNPVGRAAATLKAHNYYSLITCFSEKN